MSTGHETAPASTNQTVVFSGTPWWSSEDSVEELRKAASLDATIIQSLKITDFEIDTRVAAFMIKVLQRHGHSITDLVLTECTGHIDIIVTVAMTIARLESLKLSSGALSSYAHSLGVGLHTNSNLRTLILVSGCSVFFTLTADSAASLEKGLSASKSLETFHFVNCRFGDGAAIRSLSNGLLQNQTLRHIALKSCFAANGQILPDDSLAVLLNALQHSSSLKSLDISGNKCLRHGMNSLSILFEKTQLGVLNLSCQVIDEGQFVNLASIVAALGATRTLESLELGFNKLDDRDVPYLAAALSYNTSIKYIGLANNRITNTGLSILASKVPNMKGIEKLALDGNPFDEHGLMELAHSLQSNASIKRLKLDSTFSNHDRVMYQVDLNWSGRKFFFSKTCDREFYRGLWPLVFERLNKLLDEQHGKQRHANVLYTLLTEGSALFPL
eukprot:scaffold4183_cov137-Cylindrotheca_fusiformis.AAC.16